ncbi:MAG: YkgJ family cysteine cluster protein, partial [Nitrososphaera sp.]
MKKKFSCVQGCSDCCIYREYYPSFEYGKIGVLVLPEEKAAIERLAKNMGVRVRIIPRLAVGKNSPDKIIAYQMMGKNEDG